MDVCNWALTTLVAGKIRFVFNDEAPPITVELEGGGTILDYLACALAFKGEPFRLSGKTCIGKSQEDGEAILVSI